MTINIRSHHRGLVALGCVLALTAAGAGTSDRRFYPDDPIARIVDAEDAARVQERQLDLEYDTLENLFSWPGDRTANVRAQNLNTMDEVPDSAWFTNRLGAAPLTTADLVRGPGAGVGPAPGPWVVTAAKSDGVMPGFTVRDAAGDTWFVKFDPPGYPAMATGTEVVVSRLFWALGYHVPETHLAALREEDLTISAQARITTPSGRRRPIKPSDLRSLLKRAHREIDGSYRVVASRALEGRPVGGFLFHGTRSDDPNDVVPHEHRRELRGYGTFSAWLNHVDLKSINTLDTVVEHGGRQVVRHHLLDFGSTIGSAGVYPREAYEGWEDLAEGRQTLAGVLSLGLYVKSWRTIPMYRARAVGAFPLDNTQWDPERWKPRYVNSAFRSARMDDKFWAARRLQALTDDMLTALVAVGRFNDPQSERMVTTFLSERRAAILKRYLPAINPVTDVRVSPSGTVTFHNAAVEAGTAAPPEAYVIAWHRFDNATGLTTPVGETRAVTPGGSAPRGLPTAPGSYIRVDISATGAPASWLEPAHAYFRRDAAGWTLVGFERMPGGNPPAGKGAHHETH